MHVNSHAHSHLHLCTCTPPHTHIHACKVHTRKRVHIHVHACTHSHMHTKHTLVCLHIYSHSTHICIHVYTHACAHSQPHMHLHTNLYTLLCVHIHTHIHMCLCITYIHMSMHTCAISLSYWETPESSRSTWPQCPIMSHQPPLYNNVQWYNDAPNLCLFRVRKGCRENLHNLGTQSVLRHTARCGISGSILQYSPPLSHTVGHA